MTDYERGYDDGYGDGQRDGYADAWRETQGEKPRRTYRIEILAFLLFLAGCGAVWWATGVTP